MLFPEIYFLGKNRVLFNELSNRLKNAGCETFIADPDKWPLLRRKSPAKGNLRAPAIFINESEKSYGLEPLPGTPVPAADHHLYLVSSREKMSARDPLFPPGSFYFLKPVDPEQLAAAVLIFIRMIRLKQQCEELKGRPYEGSRKRTGAGKEHREMEMDLFNRELAESATYASLKNRILQLVKKDFTRYSKTHPSLSRHAIDVLIREIDGKVRIDTDWYRIRALFDKIYPGFTERLRNLYPGLTPHDHKLCSLLKMQMTTREIAQVMKITPASAEISRIRLRKKMRLAKKVNLVSFISGI